MTRSYHECSDCGNKSTLKQWLNTHEELVAIFEGEDVPEHQVFCPKCKGTFEYAEGSKEYPFQRV